MSEEDLLAPAQFDDVQAELPEPQPEPEVDAAPAPQPEKVEQTVPLAALQSERAENKSLKARIPELERKIEQLVDLVQRTNAPKPQPIDPIADPDRFTAAVQAQIAAVAAHTEAEISERFARTNYGDEMVNAAFEDAKAAGVIDQFRGRKDPWGDLVKWHKAQTVAREIGDDPEAYKARLRQQIIQEMQIPAAVGQSAIRPAPSLAGQPNLGTRQTQPWAGPASLDEILGGKGSEF